MVGWETTGYTKIWREIISDICYLVLEIGMFISDWV